MPTPVHYSPDVEMPEPGEAETSMDLNRTLHTILETTSKDYGHAVRSVHAKSHGLLEGELTILDGLPEVLAQGLAARPGTHTVVMRISTNAGDILPDSISLPRGLALKVLDVDGERLPDSEGDRTQDFVLVNGPAFGAAKAKQFLSNLKMLAKTTDKAEGSKKALSAILRGAEALVEAVGSESPMLKQLGGHPNTHPLGDTFFSQTAYRYGDYIVKFSVAPVSPHLTALTNRTINIAGRDNALREEIDAVIAAQGGEWELRVQLCTDVEAMPVEDPSVVWDENESPFRAVAKIVVLPQNGWCEEKSRRIDDGMLFSPWHGLAAHQPLGSINRVRRSAYPMSAKFRAAFNGCPIHEPAS